MLYSDFQLSNLLQIEYLKQRSLDGAGAIWAVEQATHHTHVPLPR